MKEIKFETLQDQGKQLRELAEKDLEHFKDRSNFNTLVGAYMLGYQQAAIVRLSQDFRLKEKPVWKQ